MTVQPISHSEREELGEVSLGEIFHEYPGGISYFVYADDQVFDAELVPAGESNARLTILNKQINEHGSIVTKSDTILDELDDTVEIFMNAWVS